jgi:glucose-1-phosphate cytidylyltransferase
MTTTQAVSRFGVVDIGDNGSVLKFREKPKVTDWINIGYFVFQPEIFNYLDHNSVLEEEPLRKLADQNQIGAYQHKGFWQPMDTFRESQMLNDIWDSGKAPWRVWK